MKTKRSKTITLDSCQFPFADGRQCRMLRHKDHPSLCLFHAREEQQFLESPRLGTEISATLSGSFYYATDINHVLGKVFTAFAQRRISQRDAATMAYLGQLMLQSVPTVKEETTFEYTRGLDGHERQRRPSLPSRLARPALSGHRENLRPGRPCHSIRLSSNQPEP